jgi:transposase
MNGAKTTDVSLDLRALVFQMHDAGYTQDAIAAYTGKSKGTINEMLKPLQKGKGSRPAK